MEGDLLDSFGDELRALRNSQQPQDIKHRAKLHTDILTPLFSALSYPQAQHDLWRLDYHDFL